MDTHAPQIVFCADDFGSHELIDEAIIDLSHSGILGAVSVLITAPRFSEARLRELVRAGVKLGLHLALTDTEPVTDCLEGTPWVVDGKFVKHWRNLRWRLLRSWPPSHLLYEEWRMQFDKLFSLTGRVDFIDSHQNVHLLPPCTGAVHALLRHGKTCGVRVFFDRTQFASPVYTAAMLYGRWSYRDCLQVPTWGLYASGQLTLNVTKQLVNRICERGAGGWIVCHPGTGNELDPPLNYRLHWQAEYELLRSPAFTDYLCSKGVNFGRT